MSDDYYRDEEFEYDPENDVWRLREQKAQPPPGKEKAQPPPTNTLDDQRFRRLNRASSGWETAPPPPRRSRQPQPHRRDRPDDRTYVPPPPPRVPPPLPPRRGRRSGFGSGAWISVLVVVLLLSLAVCGMVAAYAVIASDLPSPAALRGQSATFVSTQIYDRNGALLYEILDPTGGRRILVPYEEISPYLVNATVATEDPRFWQHPGVDPIGIARAVLQNVEAGGIVSGASTIPQQLVRLVFLSPEERTEQSLGRKVREAILASEVSRRYPKRDILEIYLNEINYGNLAYGIEAASETYFGTTAGELTLAQASFLAGLPQAPAYWDPHTNLEGAKRRQGVVLRLMVEAGDITQAEADAALAEPLDLEPLRVRSEAPHFVTWVQQLLEQKYGADVLYRSGLRVYTTLDGRIQNIAQEEARAHLQTLADRHATNAAVVAMQPNTGEILAMLGSADFGDPSIDGQVNVALRPRQPGSS
ncbi:MAG: transglycosylase domain-containing protein, partial [Anaerolineae bacterium]